MKIGIMGAMHDEIALLKDELKDAKTEEYGGRTYHSGTLYGADVVLVFSRWGKVASSITATTLINKFNINKLIFTGVAGATDPNINIGDIVIGKTLYQHDMDARPIFKKSEIPLTGKIFFDADNELVFSTERAVKDFFATMDTVVSNETLQSFSIKKPSVYIGKIASGDAFISSKLKTESLVEEMPDVLAVEMEGAAVAQVCSEHAIPFIVVRTISDKADHGAVIDFQKFVGNVAKYYSKGVVESLCKHSIVNNSASNAESKAQNKPAILAEADTKSSEQAELRSYT